MLTMHPLEPGELRDAAQLCPRDPNALLGHLRWCMCTPYAEAFSMRLGPKVLGVATLVHFGTTSRVGCFHIHQAHQRKGLGTLLALHLRNVQDQEDRSTLMVQAAPQEAAFWERLEFTEQCTFTTYANGHFIEASRDEVALMEPAHTLALLHLDKHATGEDRRALLLEHQYAAHAYVEQGRVRGALLPLVGQGLIIADAPAVGLELQRWLLPTQHRITVPADNAAANEHLRERGYDPIGSSVRLVHGSAPAFKAEMVFAWPWGR
ncbi:MAG: GNAT family N-acetyltransferase [Flavobacteriales bacterium]|nr:GNAT family N-acetyltransferase [Flavobacteriales bacterium]